MAVQQDDPTAAARTIAFYVLDNTGAPCTDAASTLTVRISLDGVTTTHTTGITRLDNTNHPGVYLFVIPQAQTAGQIIVLRVTSSEVDRTVIPETTTMRTSPLWVGTGSVFGTSHAAATDTLEAIRQMMEDSLTAILRS